MMRSRLIRRILVVDDEEQYRTMVYQCLRWMGYECETAEDAAAAMEKIGKGPYDLVISDIRMQGKDGLELTREARRLHPEIDFIIMSGFSAEYSYSDIIGAGATDFIAKPFTTGELEAKIERVERERQILRRLNESNAALLREVVLNTSIAEVSKYLLADLPIEDITGLVMTHAVRLTDSNIGCVGLFQEDDSPTVCFSLDIHQTGQRPASVRELSHPRLLEFLREHQQASGGESFSMNECTIELPGGLADGPFILHRFISTPASVDGISLGRVMVANAERDYTTEDVRTVERLADIYALSAQRKKVQEDLRRAHSRLAKALNATINALASTIEIRDPYTAGHQRRVSKLACAMAEGLGLSADRIESIRMAGLVHDIGKIGVPSEILSKPSLLKDFEFGLIKHHSQTGYDILKDVDFPQPIAQIVLQHHERMNGNGYPLGLRGAEILVEARIVSVADVVEAMSSHRPYRPALGIKTALEEISRNKDVLYDGDAVEACLDLFNRKDFTFD